METQGHCVETTLRGFGTGMDPLVFPHHRPTRVILGSKQHQQRQQMDNSTLSCQSYRLRLYDGNEEDDEDEDDEGDDSCAWEEEEESSSGAEDHSGPLRRRVGAHAGFSSGRSKRRRVVTIVQRQAANIRERKRMFGLNEAFDALRRRVPTFAYEKRLSRIDTLRLAMLYISFMTDLLENRADH